MNTLKTFFLMFIMTALFVLVGEMLAGQDGMIFAFVLAVFLNFISYWFSDSIVLSSYRAKRVTPQVSPELCAMVEELAKNSYMPVPKLYVIKTDMPNAFATGRNQDHAAVALTTGIIKLLNEDELRGVISHELSHIKNKDILIGTITAVFAGAILMLTRMASYRTISASSRRRDNGNFIIVLLTVILAPLAAMLIQSAVSRTREYLADETGASICGNPLALASALKKLSEDNEQGNYQVTNNTAHMFIVSPLTTRDLRSLFSTHPPIKDRIKKLENMAGIYNSAKNTMTTKNKKTENNDGTDIPKVIY